MSYETNKLESQIAASLERCARSVKQTSRGRWEFAVVNGKSLPMTARLSEEWLTFDAPVGDRLASRDLWRLLLLNGALGGPCKFVLMRDRSAVHLRADLPLQDGEDDVFETGPGNYSIDATALSEVCSQFKVAFRGFKGEEMVPRALPQIDSAGREHWSEALRQRCTEANWPFIERSPGALTIELDVRGCFYQAIVQQRGLGAHVSVELSSYEGLAGRNRQALSVLMLSAGGQVKLARPAVEEQANRIAARFEVFFASIPRVTELTHALSALSLASELCGREAKAIQDDTVARHYLAIANTAAEPAESGEEQMVSAAD